MADTNPDRLSGIETHWTQLLHAPDGPSQLVVSYFGAAQRYLLAMVGDAAVAEDLAQDFAVRFLRGDYRHANPAKGRFRDFLKTCLRNLVRDGWRGKNKARLVTLPADLATQPDEPECDRLFLAGWRDQLLNHAWKALAEYAQATGKPYDLILRWRTEDAALAAEQIGKRLAQEGKPKYSAEAIRQLLHRGRERFAQFLLEEVTKTLGDADPDHVEEELAELALLEYCRPGLGRLHKKP